MLRAAFIIALLGVALTACKSGPTCPVQVRTDAGQALADHAATKAGWRSLKAEARVTGCTDVICPGKTGGLSISGLMLARLLDITLTSRGSSAFRSTRKKSFGC